MNHGTITFPCSDCLSYLVKEILQDLTSPAVLLCSVYRWNNWGAWKQVGFLWQSHWAPRPSCLCCVPWILGFAGFYMFTCVSSNTCNTFPLLSRILLFYFWISVLHEIQTPNCPIPQCPVSWSRAVVRCLSWVWWIHTCTSLQQAGTWVPKWYLLNLDSGYL